jgi:uncharacterized protein (TIGR02646 family)
MLLRIRRKADPLENIGSISEQEHLSLKTAAATDATIWGISEGPYSPLVKSFRSEVKQYYWERQARKCCYCSKELDQHKGSYDAEHILHKDEHPQFMFHTQNLAVACKTCNGVKSNKSVTHNPPDFNHLPEASEDYKIVHPHLDDWDHFFRFDLIDRIIAVNQDAKALETISICGISCLNSARLADHFLPADHNAVQMALEGFFRVKRRGWKIKYIEMLEKMIAQHNLASAHAIVEVLREEIH